MAKIAFTFTEEETKQLAELMADCQGVAYYDNLVASFFGQLDPPTAERGELWFCAGCHAYTDSPEIDPESDGHGGDEICPTCGADRFYFSDVETHGAFDDEAAAQIIAEYEKTGRIPS